MCIWSNRTNTIQVVNIKRTRPRVAWKVFKRNRFPFLFLSPNQDVRWALFIGRKADAITHRDGVPTSHGIYCFKTKADAKRYYDGFVNPHRKYTVLPVLIWGDSVFHPAEWNTDVGAGYRAQYARPIPRLLGHILG